MHRIDNSRFLLYIEPSKTEKLVDPINDELTEIMQRAFNESIEGGANYYRKNKEEEFRKGDGFFGWHNTDCGETSSNHDYLLKNGMITNSLCIFYLQYYRNSIPESELNKVKELVKFYKEIK